MKKLDSLVIGATGATGQEIVSQLLEDNSFNSISIFVRKNPNITHSKLKTYVIDFSKVEDFRDLVKGDVLFSCLGTTLRDAGSKDKQYLVDYTYQYEFAKIASENEVPNYSLVSSAGANENALFFYPKIKGKLEESIKKLPFKTIQIFQPPTLIRQKNLMRTSEKIGIKMFGILNYFGILKSQKPLPVSILAKVVVEHLKMKQKEKVKTIKTFH
ncbi:MAG: NAD(P)H-binding protein [Flavobacteriaceae bacterium]